MSCEFLEGFDHYAVAQMAQKGWVIFTGGVMQPGRWTGQCWQTFNSANIQYPLPLGNLASRVIGFAFQPEGGAAGSIYTGTDMFRLCDGLNGGGVTAAETQLQFQVAAGGYIQVVRGVNGSGGTILATASTGPTLTNGTWYYIEVKVTISAGAGAVQVNISNGVTTTTVINISGVNTQNTANATFSSIWIGGPKANFDDMYVFTTAGSVNNTFNGESRIIPVWMNSNGHSTQFTPLASTNVSQIDETLVDDDTSYNSSSTVGNIDAFNPQTLSSNGPIAAVQTNLTARKDDVSARSVAVDIYDGTTDFIGTTHGITSSYADYLDVYEKDPSTSAAWTVAVFNSRQFGYKMIS